MTYEGRSREVLSDGSIRVVARPLASRLVATAGYFLTMLAFPAVAMATRGANLALVMLVCEAPFVLALMPRLLSRRTVVFDAQRREAQITDSGMQRRKSVIPFGAIQDLSLVQREPRAVSNQPPTLVVNGQDLFVVGDTFANHDLELELKKLVGLPSVESPRDVGGLSGF